VSPHCVLICADTHDTVACVAGARRAARLAPKRQLRGYPIGHFDICHGAAQSQALGDRIEFLDRTVTGKAAL
jgi:hypothetical protein